MTVYTNAIRTIDEVAEGVLMKVDYPEGQEYRVKQLVFDGYRELNLVVLPQGQIVDKFTMDSNYIIYMPDEMSLVNRVAVEHDGKMWPLTLEPEMIPTTSVENGAEVLDSDWGEGEDIIKRGAYYASRGGMNLEGYYYPDYVKRRILFRNVSRSDVLIDYMTTGIEKQSTTYVPTYAVGAIEAYVRLNMELNKQMPHPNVIAVQRDEYERQKSICRGIKFNMVDWLDTIYKNWSVSVYR